MSNDVVEKARVFFDECHAEVTTTVLRTLTELVRQTEGLTFTAIDWATLKIAAEAVATTCVLDAKTRLGPLTPTEIETYMAAVARQNDLFAVLGVENPYIAKERLN